MNDNGKIYLAFIDDIAPQVRINKDVGFLTDQTEDKLLNVNPLKALKSDLPSLKPKQVLSNFSDLDDLL